MDVRGIVWFLALTYGVSAGIAYVAHLLGVGVYGGVARLLLQLQAPLLAAYVVGRHNLDYPIPLWTFRGVRRRWLWVVALGVRARLHQNLTRCLPRHLNRHAETLMPLRTIRTDLRAVVP